MVIMMTAVVVVVVVVMMVMMMMVISIITSSMVPIRQIITVIMKVNNPKGKVERASEWTMLKKLFMREETPAVGKAKWDGFASARRK